MKLFNKKILLTLFIIIGIFSFCFSVIADEGSDEGELQIAWPASPTGSSLEAGSDITDLVKYLYDWGISIGALLCFVVLIVAGFNYLTSTGDTGKIGEAKKKMQGAFVGLILLLGSYIILQTINPSLTQLSPPSLDPNQYAKDSGKISTFELSGDCAYAILYKNAKDMENDFTEASDSIAIIPVDGSITVLPPFQKILGGNVYNAVQFYIKPVLKEISIQNTTDENGEMTTTEEEYEIFPEDYPKTFSDKLVEINGEKVMKATGNECRLYLYKEAACASLLGWITGIANVEYSTYNITNTSNVSMDEIYCMSLVSTKSTQ